MHCGSQFTQNVYWYGVDGAGRLCQRPTGSFKQTQELVAYRASKDPTSHLINELALNASSFMLYPDNTYHLRLKDLLENADKDLGPFKEAEVAIQAFLDPQSQLQTVKNVQIIFFSRSPDPYLTRHVLCLLRRGIDEGNIPIQVHHLKAFLALGKARLLEDGLLEKDTPEESIQDPKLVNVVEQAHNMAVLISPAHASPPIIGLDQAGSVLAAISERLKIIKDDMHTEEAEILKTSGPPTISGQSVDHLPTFSSRQSDAVIESDVGNRKGYKYYSATRPSTGELNPPYPHSSPQARWTQIGHERYKPL